LEPVAGAVPEHSGDLVSLNDVADLSPGHPA
jgi:hypothetical protein